MKTIRIFIILVAILMCNIAAFGQSADFYKQQIESCLSKGDCDKAQIMYDSWKELSGMRNTSIEKAIEDCKENQRRLQLASLDYVEINGVKWARQNVGEPGEFVDGIFNIGNYYTFKEAQTVCPKGWRIPTKEEFDSLKEVNNVWTGFGRFFSNEDDDIVYFPAGGGHKGRNNPIIITGGSGWYWSSSSYSSSNKSLFMFGWADGHVFTRNYPASYKISVRCVFK